MASAAPNPAAEDIPRVKGDAIGFLREACMTTPPSANPAPAKTAASALGNLISQTIASKSPSLFRRTVIACKGEMYIEPTHMDAVNAKAKQEKRKRMNMVLFHHSLLYCATTESATKTTSFLREIELK